MNSIKTNTRTRTPEKYSAVERPLGTISKQTQGLEPLKNIVLLKDLQELYQNNTRTRTPEKYSAVERPPGTISRQTQGLEPLKNIVLLREFQELYQNKHKD